MLSWGEVDLSPPSHIGDKHMTTGEVRAHAARLMEDQIEASKSLQSGNISQEAFDAYTPVLEAHGKAVGAITKTVVAGIKLKDGPEAQLKEELAKQIAKIDKQNEKIAKMVEKMKLKGYPIPASFETKLTLTLEDFGF